MKKILIVQKNDYFSRFVSAWLTENNYEVESADSYIRGINKLKTFGPDVVILVLPFPPRERIHEIMLEYNKSSGAWRVIVAIYRTGAIADDSIDTQIKRYLQYGCWDAFEIPATLDGEFLGKEKLKIKLSATVSNAIESIQKSHLLT